MQVIYVLARCSVFSLGREEKGHKPKRKLKTKLNGFFDELHGRLDAVENPTSN